MGGDGVVDDFGAAVGGDGGDGVGEVGTARGFPIMGVPQLAGLAAAEAEGSAYDGFGEVGAILSGGWRVEEEAGEGMEGGGCNVVGGISK